MNPKPRSNSYTSKQCVQCGDTADKITRKMNRNPTDIVRTYSELIKLPTFKERFEYLKLDGIVGEDTFGFDRYINQQFYRSPEWKRIRDLVIVRDNGCNLAIDGYFIRGRVYIHHMNPITQRDILGKTSILMDPEFLICVSHDTHNAIHYGNATLLRQDPIVRRPNDTCPWKN